METKDKGLELFKEYADLNKPERETFLKLLDKTRIERKENPSADDLAKGMTGGDYTAQDIVRELREIKDGYVDSWLLSDEVMRTDDKTLKDQLWLIGLMIYNLDK
jgi:hypothetical protein